MARTVIPIVTVGSQGIKNAIKTFGVAADTANNHSMVNDGQTELWVLNGDAILTPLVTVKGVADPVFGRAADLTGVVPVLDSLTAGPFKPSGFNVGGLVEVDIDTTDAEIILVGVRRSNAGL